MALQSLRTKEWVVLSSAHPTQGPLGCILFAFSWWESLSIALLSVLSPRLLKATERN